MTVTDFGQTEVVSGFPAMVRLDPELVDYDLIRSADGRDLAFFPDPWSEGDAPLPHTISVWNPGGTSIVWVRLPPVLPGETSFWMYYGSDTFSIEDAGSDVWDSGYVLVMHYEGDDGFAVDAGPFGNDGYAADELPASYSAPESTPGLVGDAAQFRENRDAIVVPPSTSLATMNPRTVSMLVRLDELTDTRRIIGKSEWFLSLSPNSGGRFQTRTQFNDDGDGNDVFGQWDSAPPIGDWFHLTLSWGGRRAGSSVSLWIDGVPIGIRSGTGDGVNDQDDDGAESLIIGNGEAVGTLDERAIRGALDELRISRTARSAAWIRAEYLSATNQLLTFGTPELVE